MLTLRLFLPHVQRSRKRRWHGDTAGECVLLHLVQQNPPALRAAPFTKGGFQVLPFIKGETEGISPAVSHGCRTPTSAKQKPLAKAVHEVARQGVEPRSPYGESVLYRYGINIVSHAGNFVSESVEHRLCHGGCDF